MSCDQVQALLAAYTENDLTAEDKAMVEGHVHSCRECALYLSLLREADEALAAFPQIDPGRELLERLIAIPIPKSRFRTIFETFRKPSLQPVMAAATVFLAVLSLYLLNPDRKQFDKAILRTFHRGIGQVEKLYAQAGSVTDTLGSYAENVFVSLKSINPLSRSKD
jgi:hypothetical protein